MIFYTKNPAGFSLIEMLVAVSILLLVIVGPMSITARTAKSSTFATEQVQAFFLAQEGLELVQKVRDDFLLEYFANPVSYEAWTRFTDNGGSGKLASCYGGNGCGLQWPQNSGGSTDIGSVSNCTTAGACALWFDRNGNEQRAKFTHRSTGNEATRYTRVIRLTQVGDSVLVRSTVTWRTGSLVADQQVEVTTYLYKIYDPS